VTAVCPNCLREQRDGILCSGCTSTLEYELGEVPAILADLDTTLAKQARLGATGHGGLASERASFHDGARLAVDYLQNTLVTWARDVSGESWLPAAIGPATVRRSPDAVTAGPFCPTCRHRSCMALRLEERRPAPPASAQAAWFLLGHMPEIRRHPAVEQLVDEVIEGIRQARRATDRIADRQYLGTCRATTDGVTCTEELWAPPAAREVQCTVCGTEYVVAERRAWLLELAADRLVTVREAAQWVGAIGRIAVTEAAIRGYIHRDRIAYRAPTTLRRIRLGDLLDVVLDDAEKRPA
jgi:hypothetical protein